MGSSGKTGLLFLFVFWGYAAASARRGQEFSIGSQNKKRGYFWKKRKSYERTQTAQTPKSADCAGKQGKSVDYLRAHPLIEFSTLWHQENYAIFAVLDVSLDAKSEQFLDFFSHPTFESDTEFKTYVRKAQLLSMYAIPIDVQPSDALLTLSTCLDENRLVILARRQREGERLSSLRAEVQMAVRQ